MFYYKSSYKSLPVTADRLPMIEAFLIAIAALTTGLIAIYSLKNGIGPVPSNGYVKKQLLAALPGSVPGDILELGAGWGGISLALAKAYPDNKVIAVENSLPVWLFCWLRGRVWRISGKLTNLEVRLGNIHHTGLRGAGLIYCYLHPAAMEQLSSRLQDLSPGCVLVSNTFSVPGLAPQKRLQAADLWKSQIFCYRL